MDLKTTLQENLNDEDLSYLIIYSKGYSDGISLNRIIKLYPS